MLATDFARCVGIQGIQDDTSTRVDMKRKVKPSDLAPLLLLRSQEESENQRLRSSDGNSSVDLSDEGLGAGI